MAKLVPTHYNLYKNVYNKNVNTFKNISLSLCVQRFKKNLQSNQILETRAKTCTKIANIKAWRSVQQNTLYFLNHANYHHD